MQRVIKLVMVFLLLAASSIAVMATPLSTVTSDPALFSLVKTDTGSNNNVEVLSNSLKFTPGTGIGGEMFGFQPGSSYYYEGLCQIENVTDDSIYVWYTLTGDLKDLYDKGIFSLELGESSLRWEEYQNEDNGDETGLLEINSSSASPKINFNFQIPPGYLTDNNEGAAALNGNIVVHANGTLPGGGLIINPEDPSVTPDPIPSELPKTDWLGNIFSLGISFLIILTGLYMLKKKLPASNSDNQ